MLVYQHLSVPWLFVCLLSFSQLKQAAVGTHCPFQGWGAGAAVMSAGVFSSHCSCVFRAQAEGEDSLKKMQLMELAILNGTYRDANVKSRKPETGVQGHSRLRPFVRRPCSAGRRRAHEHCSGVKSRNTCRLIGHRQSRFD